MIYRSAHVVACGCVLCSCIHIHIQDVFCVVILFPHVRFYFQNFLLAWNSFRSFCAGHGGHLGHLLLTVIIQYEHSRITNMLLQMIFGFYIFYIYDHSHIFTSIHIFLRVWYDFLLKNHSCCIYSTILGMPATKTFSGFETGKWYCQYWLYLNILYTGGSIKTPVNLGCVFSGINKH